MSQPEDSHLSAHALLESGALLKALEQTLAELAEFTDALRGQVEEGDQG